MFKRKNSTNRHKNRADQTDPNKRPNHARETKSEKDQMPLVAIWYQVRAAVADLIIPLLASLKTLWLLFIQPVAFFRAMFFRTKSLNSLLTPFDPFWRTLTDEEREPLESAPFLLFGIVTAVLANFEFGTSGRLLGLISGDEAGDINSIVAAASDLVPSQSDRLQALVAFSETEFFAQLTEFVDPAGLVVIAELFINLVQVVIFAYLFYLFSGRKVSATHSYTFWLYVAGLQFVTTAFSRLLFNFYSLPTFSSLPVTPDQFFIILETGLLVIWYYLYPAYTLPRIFPDTISGKRVLIASILGRGLMAAAGWLLFGGFILMAPLFGS